MSWRRMDTPRWARRAALTALLALSLALICTGEEYQGDQDVDLGEEENWWGSGDPERAGYSNAGEVFTSPKEAWATVLKDKSKAQWYKQVIEYWDEQQKEDNSGVLQGYQHLHEPDTKDSRLLIHKTYDMIYGAGWLEEHGHELKALELGAGIGRLTRAMLLPLFGEVEIIEPSKVLLSKAEEVIQGESHVYNGRKHVVTGYHQKSLHEFKYGKNKYDVVWVQWVLVYLVDDDMQIVLKKITRSLKPGGIVFVKENVSDRGFIVDGHSNGGTMTRSVFLMLEEFDAAGFEVKTDMVQSGFDKDVYSVHMWALQRKGEGQQGKQSEL